MFKDLRTGSPVYILDRKEITVTQGTLINAPLSHFDPKFGTNKMVVDLEIEAAGTKTSFVVEDSQSAAYFADKTIACSKEAIVRELETIKSTSESALKMMPYHQQAIPKCEALMRQYSAEYRERTETQERITNLEGKLDTLTSTIKSFMQSVNIPQN